MGKVNLNYTRLLEEAVRELSKIQTSEADDLIGRISFALSREPARVFIATGSEGEGFVAQADPVAFDRVTERGRALSNDDDGGDAWVTELRPDGSIVARVRMIELLRPDGSVAYRRPETDPDIAEWATMIRLGKVAYSLRYVGGESPFLEPVAPDPIPEPGFFTREFAEKHFDETVQAIVSYAENAASFPKGYNEPAVAAYLFAALFAAATGTRFDPILPEPVRRIAEGMVFDLQHFKEKRIARLFAAANWLIDEYNVATKRAIK